MTITIRKEGDGLYSAKVTMGSLAWRSKEDDKGWETPNPMPWRELYQKLREKGCNVIEIDEAYDAGEYAEEYRKMREKWEEQDRQKATKGGKLRHEDTRTES